MGKIEVKAEFPCGFKVEIKASSLFLDGHIDNISDIQCPLHGKDCHK